MADARPITDVVFDFCGVLVDWQCHCALDGHVDAGLVERICADDDPYGFFHYEDLMDGGMRLDDVLPIAEREQGKDIAAIYRYYIEHYGDALPGMVAGMEELLRDLKAAGVHVWGLTNWAEETFHFAFDRFPRLEGLLEGTVVSGAERMHKPEAPIYRLAEERFSLDPSTTVFVDDTAKNVAGAEALGWHGIRFTDAAGARDALRGLGAAI